MTTPVTKGSDPIDLLAQRLIAVYGVKEELDVKDLLGVIKAEAPITEAAAAAPKAASARASGHTRSGRTRHSTSPKR